MTRSLFLAPHNDDETLFGAFTIQAWHPDVMVCFLSAKQTRAGVEPTERVRESLWAMKLLGARGFYQLEILDSATDTEARAALAEILRGAHKIQALAGRRPTDYEVVFAPAVEDGGHEQHTLVGTRSGPA